MRCAAADLRADGPTALQAIAATVFAGAPFDRRRGGG